MEVDLDPRKGLAEADQEPRHIELSRRKGRPHRDPAADQSTELVDLVADAIDLGEDVAGTLGDRLARLGHRHGSACALEQLRAELPLETTDLVGERRLSDVQLLGRPGEVTVTCDRLGISQLAELHEDPS